MDKPRVAGLVILCLLAGQADALDGGTLRIKQADGTRATIRLAGIDAPEKAQPFGRAAGRRLAAICLGKRVGADARKIDRYGRTVARIRCDGHTVDLANVPALGFDEVEAIIRDANPGHAV